jgi:hypothetical protein
MPGSRYTRCPKRGTVMLRWATTSFTRGPLAGAAWAAPATGPRTEAAVNPAAAAAAQRSRQLVPTMSTSTVAQPAQHGMR